MATKRTSWPASVLSARTARNVILGFPRRVRGRFGLRLAACRPNVLGLPPDGQMRGRKSLLAPRNGEFSRRRTAREPLGDERGAVLAVDRHELAHRGAERGL